MACGTPLAGHPRGAKVAKVAKAKAAKVSKVLRSHGSEESFESWANVFHQQTQLESSAHLAL